VSDDPRPLLVYDGSRRLFRTAANRLTDGAALRPVRWGHESVQAFLDAQFGSRPFAFILVEDDHVHVGAETVVRLLRKGGIDGGVARLLERAYPTVAGPFGGGSRTGTRGHHRQFPTRRAGAGASRPPAP
jgi:hypothetical protein